MALEASSPHLGFTTHRPICPTGDSTRTLNLALRTAVSGGSIALLGVIRTISTSGLDSLKSEPC
jgi:hypothetical protein